MGYDMQLMNVMQGSPDSVFQDGNQRSIYVISFRPPIKGNDDEKISFDFYGNRLFISGECHPEFAVGVPSDSQPVDPKSIDAVLLTHAHLEHCGIWISFYRIEAPWDAHGIHWGYRTTPSRWNMRKTFTR